MLDVLPLRLSFQYSSALILYHVLVLQDVPALRTLFTVDTPTCMNARRIPTDLLTLKLPRVHTERARQNFAYWGAKLWNCIPAAVRRCQSLQTFATMYLIYLRSRLSLSIDPHYDILDFL